MKAIGTTITIDFMDWPKTKQEVREREKTRIPPTEWSLSHYCFICFHFMSNTVGIGYYHISIFVYPVLFLGLPCQNPPVYTNPLISTYPVNCEFPFTPPKIKPRKTFHVSFWQSRVEISCSDPVVPTIIDSIQPQ